MSNSKNVISTVRETITAYSLIKKGDSVLIGLSGGPDSVVLLHLLNNLKKKLEFGIGAVYVNHLLRPRSARKEARFCEELCKEQKVRYYYEEADISNLAEKEKRGIEETARKYRYQIYEYLADKNGYNKIALGHHRDDRVETVLFNLFRGTGRTGISGIPVIRGKIIRPLFNLCREDIIRYLDLNNHEYKIDISNNSIKYTRNRIRKRIIPGIKKEITDRAPENIIRFSEILAEEEKYLAQKSQKIYKKNRMITPGGKIKLDLTGCLKYDKWLKRRLVILMLNQSGFYEIDYGEVERVLALVDGIADSRFSLRNGYLAEKNSNSLYIFKSGEKNSQTRAKIGSSIRLEYPYIEVAIYPEDFKGLDILKDKKPDTAYVDAGKLSGDLYIAGLRRGLRFRPYGRPGSKKAGDFLTDRKYPRPLRDELPVLYDQRGVVCLIGLEIDHRVKIDKTTKKMVKIEISGN